MSAPYLGDYKEDATLDFKWSTNDASGASITRSTDGTVSVYKANGTTQSVAGVTDTEDFDSLTGIHHCRIDLSADAFYATANDYQVVLSAATIDGQTVNAVIAHFSIENRFAEVDVVALNGAVQSLLDLKDFADAGYDPATNKVEGVKLSDTTTTNTDMRGTDSAALATVCTEPRLSELDAGNLPSDVDAILADVTGLNGDAMRGTDSAALAATIGTPADIDGGGATIADNLKKIADDSGGLSFDATTDSLESIRDRGDAAWITGGGGGLTDILNVQPLIPKSIDLANTATVRISLGLTNMVDDLPTTAEITPGTIAIDRKAIGGTSWTNILSDVACLEVDGLIYYDEVFNSGTGYAEGDSIRLTFKNQLITVAANDYEITGTDGWIFQTSIRQTMRGTDSGALASVATEARLAELDAGNIPGDIDDLSSRLPAALVTGRMSSDAVAISGDTTAADNLESQYDTTGLTGDTFPSTQAQLNNIANTGSAINTAADSDTLTTGTETSGTFADTATLNGVYHQISDDTGEIEIYYEFDVGGDGVPTAATWIGRLEEGAPANSEIVVYAYNWGGTSWDQVGTIEGQLSSTDLTEDFTLFTSHVGTGANLGKVRIRFFDDGLSSGDSELYTDQIYVSYAVVTRTVGYEGGMIWIDTVNGAAGTTAYINGTADNPVDNLADGLTLLSSVGLNGLHIAQGSSVTFIQTMNNLEITGIDYTIAFGGQQVNNSTIRGANLSGIATGNGGSLLLESCQFQGATTLPQIAAIDCAFAATVTLGEIGTFIFERCFSAVAGTSAPIIDIGAALGNQNVNIRHYSGGLEIENFGATGSDTMSLEGWGQLILNANCAGGTIAIRGHFTITDNASGAVTLSDEARFDLDQIDSKTWLKVLENNKTAEQMLRIMLAALAEKSSGGGTPTVNFRNDADSKNRIVATVDASGNRTAITLDGT